MVALQTLENFLRSHGRIALDTNILIYFLEGHPSYRHLAEKIFESIQSGQCLGVCSTLSLLEVLVGPYRQNDETFANHYYAHLSTFPHLSWVSLSIESADAGARLRARYNLKTPDAIILATAVCSGVNGFICNDSQLKRVNEMDVLVLDS